MKKLLVLMGAFLLVFGAVGFAGAVPSSVNFEDFIDTWGGKDSKYFSEGSPFSYSHDINDDVDLSKYEVTSATLKLDFNSAYDWEGLDFDSYYNSKYVSWDYREYVRYQFDGGSWVKIGEIDTYDNPTGVDDVQYLTLDVGLLNDNGILDVTLAVYAPYGSGDISLASSKLTGEANRVPEPTTMLLLGLGIAGIAGFGRKKYLKG